jgi:hypothetical protein
MVVGHDLSIELISPRHGNPQRCQGLIRKHIRLTNDLQWVKALLVNIGCKKRQEIP